MKKWHKAALAIAVVAGGAAAAWAATNDTEGRALREQAVAKLAGKNQTRRPTMRAVGRNGTTLELSTQGLVACHKDEVAKTMSALEVPPPGTEGITAMNDPSRVYVLTPEGDLGTAPRGEIVSLRRRGFSLGSREMVAEEKATRSCGDPTVKCSPRWLAEMAATYSTGEVGHMMAALRFGRIACVGDDWEGSVPLKY